MNTSIPSSMIPLLLLLPLTVPALASRDKTIGVAPGLLSKYAPSSGDKWTCLDGSKQISWKAVNDDYCDCKDGSDEPGAWEMSMRKEPPLNAVDAVGTSACANSTFYCRNDGHIGSTIPAWQVNDGLCGRYHRVPLCFLPYLLGRGCVL